MKKLILCILLILALLMNMLSAVAETTTAAPETTAADSGIMYVTTWLNVRDLPGADSTGSKVITSIGPGTAVKVLNIDQYDWATIEFDTASGIAYCYAPYLSATP